jgi:polysaccharide biosynthesis transport protein
MRVTGLSAEPFPNDVTTMPPADVRRGDLGDVFAILRRRWFVVATMTALALIAAAAYLATAPRLYTGVATILIDTRSRPAIGDPAASTVLTAYPDAVLVESQIRVIASDAVLRRVVEAEHLASNPEFGPAAPGVRARLFQALGFAQPAAAPGDSDARAAAALARRIVVKRSERTYVVDVEVTAHDPVLAAQLANAVVKAYFDDQQAARAEVAERDSAWVLGQLKDMQADLQAAESRAEQYRREHGIIDLNGKLLNEQNLAEASSSLVQARARAAEAKARYDQIERVVQSGRNVDTLPDALRSSAMDKLRSQYNDISRQQATLRQTLGDRHPALLEAEQQMRDVKRLINDELGRIEAGIANEYQTAQANVTALEKQVQAFRTTTVASSADRVKLDELQRDIDARRAVYDRFLRARDTVKEQASDAPMGRVLAPANVPTAPSSPKTVAVLALAAVSGLLVGVGLALLSHTVGRRRPEATAPAFEMPFDTAVETPDVCAPRRAGLVPSPLGPHTLTETRPRLVERLRALWPTVDVAVENSHPAFRDAVAALPIDLPAAREAGITTLLLTSEPGSEARTTLALGIASQAAERGLRAIVIDAEGGRSLLRDLVEPGAQADLLDLMGTTRMCYKVTSPGGEPIGIVPKIGDETRAVQRVRGRAGLRHIEGLRGHFDLVLFDGPSVSDGDRFRATALSAQHVVVVVSPQASEADIKAMTADLVMPDSAAVTVVTAEPLVASDAAHAAA